jgi:hypothetical protein
VAGHLGIVAEPAADPNLGVQVQWAKPYEQSTNRGTTGDGRTSATRSRTGVMDVGISGHSAKCCALVRGTPCGTGGCPQMRMIIACGGRCSPSSVRARCRAWRQGGICPNSGSRPKSCRRLGLEPDARLCREGEAPAKRQGVHLRLQKQDVLAHDVLRWLRPADPRGGTARVSRSAPAPAGTGSGEGLRALSPPVVTSALCMSVISPCRRPDGNFPVATRWC